MGFWAGKGAGRAGTSLLKGAAHVSPLSPSLTSCKPLPHHSSASTGEAGDRIWCWPGHRAPLLPHPTGTTSTCPTWRRSPASTSRAGGRTSAAGCITPTSWTRLRTSWSVRVGEGGSQGLSWPRGTSRYPEHLYSLPQSWVLGPRDECSAGGGSQEQTVD